MSSSVGRVNLVVTVSFRHSQVVVFTLYFLVMLDALFRSFKVANKEALLLTAIANHGPQPASRLAALCGFPRNTARTILDRLVTRGLLLRSLRAQTQFYGLERKETLLKLLEFEKQEAIKEFDERLLSVKELSDDFGSAPLRKRPRVTLYEGLEGLKRVYEDTLTATTGICSWASFDENARAMPRYFASYYRRRAKLKILMRSIHPDSALAKAHHQRDRSEHRVSRLVPAGRFSVKPEIQVYNNKVNIVSWPDRLGLIIESQDIADALRSIFELSFEAAGKDEGRRR